MRLDKCGHLQDVKISVTQKGTLSENCREIKARGFFMLERFLKLEQRLVSPYTSKRFIWLLFARIGHWFFRKYPPQITNAKGKRLLNLGAGSELHTGMINADFYRLHHLFKSNSANWMLDLTRPIKCRDEFFDGILLSHVNEHVTYTQNFYLLKELYRILKVDGVIRLVVPDLDRYLAWNTLRETEKKMARYESLPEAISNLAQNHEHKSVWNAQLMAELLSEIGFSGVRVARFGDSAVDEFVDAPNHEWQSFYVEATK